MTAEFMPILPPRGSYGSPRGEWTPPDEDGLREGPGAGEFKNGMHCWVSPQGDGRSLTKILYLNPYEHRWGWYDPNPFPPLIVAPRLHALHAHVRRLRAKPGRARRRITDAWNVLRGNAYIDPDYFD